jgi:hypothetical protein
VPHLDRIEAAHRGFLARQFPGEELEDFGIWQRLLAVDEHSARYYFSVVLIVARRTDANIGDAWTVGGAAVLELYKMSRAGWLSYIAFDDAFRGRRLTRPVVQHCHAHLCESAAARLGKPLSMMILSALCLTSSSSVRGEMQPGTMDPAVRQLVWRAVGFRPIDFDFEYMGHYRGERATLAIFAPGAAGCGAQGQTGDGVGWFPAMTVARFLLDLGQGILDEEGRAGDLEAELGGYEQALLGHGATLKALEAAGVADADGPQVAVGNQFWR